MYQEQKARVRWGQVKSEEFGIGNGTRQGSVMSPIFWAVYCDPMIKRLRRLGVGAHVAGVFMGVACFADDVILIAPCLQAMQLMLNEVENFADEYNIKFSTDPVPQKSKSKCLFIRGNNRNLARPPQLSLCGRLLPWVERACHLGHELHESGSMDFDITAKKAQFIDKSVEIRSMFEWAGPSEILRALKLYLSSFYGAMLWDLASEKARQVYNAWNTAVKLSWDCPRGTKTFLLQNVLSSDMSSARTDILARYPKFFLSLKRSASYEVRILANLTAKDVRTSTGRNLRTVREACGMDPLLYSSWRVKTAIASREQVEVLPENKWRIGYLWTLLGRLQESKHIGLVDEQKELQELINSLVV